MAPASWPKRGAQLLAAASALLGRTSAETTPNVVDPHFTDVQSVAPGGEGIKLEFLWSPCSDHIFAMEKTGILTVSSTTAGETGFVYDHSAAVYSYWDHGPLGMQLHPNFPEQPYLFLFYSADGVDPTTNQLWGDACPRLVNNQTPYCQTTARLERLTLSISVNAAGICTGISFAPSAVNPYLLKEDWCSTSVTHGNGDLKFYGNDLLLTSGDSAQYFQDRDIGELPADTCYDDNLKLPQGRFRSQRMEFLHGKLLRIYGAALLKMDGQLQLGTDMAMVARGLRNPYSMVIDRNRNVYVGDVGQSNKEEINMFTAAEMAATGAYPYNAGWPCIEGKDTISRIADKAWLEDACNVANGERCSLCMDIYPCIDNPRGVGGCSARWHPPAFEFRNVVLDANYPAECMQATSAIAGLAFLDGSQPKFGTAGATNFPYNLIAADYGTGCIFTFGVKADGETPDFAGGAKLLVTGHKAMWLQTGKDGYLYSVRYGFPKYWYQHGVKASTDRPSAALELYVVDGTTGAVLSSCGPDDTCQVPVGGAIRFDGSSSMAGGAAIARYAFRFGDGSATGGTYQRATHKYQTAGTFQASLVVTDARGRASTAPATVLVGVSVSIAMTPPSWQWRLGDSIALSVVSSSPVASVSWDSDIYHCGINKCSGASDCHVHTYGVDAGYANALTSKLTPPIHDLPSQMDVTATVTLASGVRMTVTAATHCMVYNVTLGAASDNGANAPRWVIEQSGSLPTCTTPCRLPFMALGTAELLARQFQARGTNVYAFAGWTQSFPGGAIAQPAGNTPGSRDNTVPVLQDGMAITANYRRVMLTGWSGAAPPVLMGARAGYRLVEVFWVIPRGVMYDYVVVSVRSAATGLDHSVVVPRGGDAFTTIRVSGAAAATYTVRLAGFNSGSRKRTQWGPEKTARSSTNPALPCYASPGPYNDVEAVIPGTVEFERYMEGAPGLAYRDLTPGNGGGAKAFRAGTNVDVSAVPGATAGSYAIVNTTANEWLHYPVRVAATRTYSVAFHVSSAVAGAKHFYLNIDTLCKPATAVAHLRQKGVTNGYATIRVDGIRLTAGSHVLRFCVDVGNLNLDSMRFF